MTLLNRTVAAISTPPGKGGVSVIRISGNDAIAVAERVFRPKSKKPVSSLPSRYAVYGDVILRGKAIDDGMLTIFRAPASYTGEDSAEICAHGGVLVTHKVLEACLEAGAQMAEAGDFTRRAYLSGKLTLSEAEAIGNLLEAKTTGQLYLARGGAEGRLSREIQKIYDEMCSISASVYALVDYPEEDLAEMSADEMAERLSRLRGALSALDSTYDSAKVINEGISTVICGSPNTGKSSLYNALSGEELAIVTDIEGTTRDTLRTEVALGDVLLCLCDTAGIRESEDTVERIGIERSRRALDDARLIFLMLDASRPLSEGDISLIDTLAEMKDKCVIALMNKSDLALEADRNYVQKKIPRLLDISAKEGRGLAELRELVRSLFLSDGIDLTSDAIIQNARQHACAVRALAAIEDALIALSSGMPADMAACDIERAMALLCEIDGQSVGEDITAEIFSKFCVGK